MIDRSIYMKLKYYNRLFINYENELKKLNEIENLIRLIPKEPNKNNLV